MEQATSPFSPRPSSSLHAFSTPTATYHSLPPVPPRLFTANIIKQSSGLSIRPNFSHPSPCIAFHRSLLRWLISLEASRIDRPAATCRPVPRCPATTVQSKQPSSSRPHNTSSRNPFGEICQAVCLPVSSCFHPFPLPTLTSSPTGS